MKKILGGVLLLPLLMLAGCKKSDPAPSKHTVKYLVSIITQQTGTLKSGTAIYLKDDYNALTEDMTKSLKSYIPGASVWEKTVTLTGGTMADLEVSGVISGTPSGRIELLIEIDGKMVSLIPGTSVVVGNQTVVGGAIQWLVPK